MSVSCDCEFNQDFGCTDDNACNYNPVAISNPNDDCIYPLDGYDCDFNCLNDSDGDGICDENENNSAQLF